MNRSMLWLRGGLTLAVLGALAGAALMSPASAGSEATKKFVKKQVTKLESRILGDTVVVTETDTTPASNDDHDHTVKCPAGYQALGGGPVGEHNQLAVDASVPTVNGVPATSAGTAAFADGWFTRVYSHGSDAETYRVSVICAAPAA